MLRTAAVGDKSPVAGTWLAGRNVLINRQTRAFVVESLSIAEGQRLNRLGVAERISAPKG